MGLSVIILAAGQGTRMRSRLPKVLQPLAGRPLLAHVLDTARAVGATDICVVYGHGGDAVRESFPESDIRWALQAEQLGTGHAMREAMPGTPDENTVILLFGDVPLLLPATLDKMLEASTGNDLFVLTVDMDDPYGYGRIVRENDSVTGIVEEKDATESQKAIREINSGVMLGNAARFRGCQASL